jgi:hypothetical protein
MIKIDIDSNGVLDEININEMYLYLIPRITDYFSTDINYFNVPFDAFYLDKEEKQRIIGYIKKQGILSITSTVRIIDPIIKKFIINIFVTKFEDSNEDNIKEQIVNVLSDFFSNYDRHDRIIKADLIGKLKTVEGIDSLNIEFVGQENEDYHRNGALLSSNTKPVSETTYAANSSSVNTSNGYALNSVTINNSSLSVGDSTTVAYKETTYDPKKMINIDPVLGDIIIRKNDLIILRGGWKNRNGIYFSEDPRSTDGFSTVNIIWKGITYKK